MIDMQTVTSSTNLTARSSPGRGSRPIAGESALAHKLSSNLVFDRMHGECGHAGFAADADTQVVELENRQSLPERASATSEHVLMEGWAIRSEVLPDGRRQITDAYLPGASVPVCRDKGEGPPTLKPAAPHASLS